MQAVEVAVGVAVAAGEELAGAGVAVGGAVGLEAVDPPQATNAAAGIRMRARLVRRAADVGRSNCMAASCSYRRMSVNRPSSPPQRPGRGAS